MSLSDQQYEKLLEIIPVEFSLPDKAKRVHALVRLMRHSGLAIQDAVTLEPHEIQKDEKRDLYRVVTSRQKTGTHVSVPLPHDVADEVIAVTKLNGNPKHIFWNRDEGKPKAAVD